jgi:hypothetical protein
MIASPRKNRPPKSKRCIVPYRRKIGSCYGEKRWAQHLKGGASKSYLQACGIRRISNKTVSRLEGKQIHCAAAWDTIVERVLAPRVLHGCQHPAV